MKRILSIFLVICMVLPLCFSAEATQIQHNYSTSANSGIRHETCTTLEGTRVDSYYTGTYSYDNLTSLGSGDLLNALRTLMTSTQTKQTSYNDCRDKAVITDCENGDGTSINLIYCSYSTDRSHYINDFGGGWNREHVWPQSLGGFGTVRAGADLHHIRPSDSSINGTRGNLKYGNVSNGSTVSGKDYTGNAVGGAKANGYFEPLDNTKGDIARICLYVYVRWGGEFTQCNSITNVFQSVDVLLEWCALDPVDTWEMGRNEVVAAIQGNRNVFIDYPELAWQLFGKEAPEDLVTPSGQTGGNGSGSTTPTEPKPTEPAPTEPDVDDTYKPANGDVVTIYYPTGKNYLTSSASGNKLQPGSTGVELTVSVNSNGYYTFTANGKYLTAGATGNSLTFESTAGNYSLWTLEKASNGWFIKSVNAKYEGSPQYLEFYNNLFTTYGKKDTADVNAYTFQFVQKNAETPKPTEPKPTDPPACTHSNTVVRDAVEATCGQHGYTGDTYCKSCGKLLEKGQAINMTNNHSYGDWVVVEEPTSLTEGRHERECTVCGDRQSETLPALGVDPTDPSEPVVTQPTEGTEPEPTDPEAETKPEPTVKPTVPAGDNSDNEEDGGFPWIIVILVAVAAAAVCIVVVIPKGKKAAG